MPEMLKAAPNDPEILQRYADRLHEDDPKKEQILRRIVGLDPKRTTAVYELGLITARRDVTDGFRFLTKAVRQEANPETVITEAMPQFKTEFLNATQARQADCRKTVAQ